MRPPFVKDVFESGLLTRKDAPYLACSLDGVALLNTSTISIIPTSASPGAAGSKSNLATTAESTDREGLVLAAVEMNTRVAPSTLGCSVSLSGAEPVECEFGDQAFREYVPRVHTAQIVH